MSWPAYPKYTDSRVDWLGNIPDSWEVTKLRHVCSVATGDKDTINRVDDGEYPFFVRSEDIQRINSWSLDCEAVLTPGDGAVGKVFHHYIGKFDFHQRVYAFYGFRMVLGKYFFYYLSGLFAAVALDGSAKTTVDSLRMPLIKGFQLTFPKSKDDQRQIVTFLDRETAKIDTLIAKQEQLIATLREDRTATITHAVTKGLNPNVEMRESGVEWLDDVPRHWVSARLRDVIVSINSGTSVNGADVPAEPGEVGVLKTSCVSNGWFNPEANKTVFSEELSRVSCPVRACTLIVNRANTPDLVGSAGFVRDDAPHLYLSDLLWAVTVRGAEPRFLYLWMQTPVYRTQVAAWRVGTSASMQKLSQASLRSFVIALPPEKEQSEVVDFLTMRTAKIDALTGKAVRMIDTLKEFRAALITDAVTGKIDVRGAA